MFSFLARCGPDLSINEKRRHGLKPSFLCPFWVLGTTSMSAPQFLLRSDSPCQGSAVRLQVLVSNKPAVARPTSRECAAKRLLVSMSNKAASRCTRTSDCPTKGLLVSVSDETALTGTTPILRSAHRLQVSVTNKAASALP